MGIYPPPLERLIKNLTRIPGIGQKSASRVALHLLLDKGDLAKDLARSLIEVKEKIRLCSLCFNLTDSDPCLICSDPSRDSRTICVVEGPGDQLAIEESGVYKGRYHILHGVLAPLDGIGPEDIKLSHLLKRMEDEKVDELIIATNPTPEGETTASYIAKLLKDKPIRITRIAMGVPMGGDLKYMDSMTLKHAMETRHQIEK
jgi:recombination protein RecR